MTWLWTFWRIVKEADEKEGTTSTDGEEPAESYRGLRRGAAAPQEVPESLSSALPTFMEPLGLRRKWHPNLKKGFGECVHPLH